MLPPNEVLAECQSFDPQIWSDLHKDAYGYRPRADMSHMSANELDQLWDFACFDLQTAMTRERREQEDALARFQNRLRFIQSEYGAKDQEQAMRWIAQAEGCEDDYERLLWQQGIAFEDMTLFGVKAF